VSESVPERQPVPRDDDSGVRFLDESDAGPEQGSEEAAFDPEASDARFVDERDEDSPRPASDPKEAGGGFRLSDDEYDTGTAGLKFADDLPEERSKPGSGGPVGHLSRGPAVDYGKRKRAPGRRDQRRNEMLGLDAEGRVRKVPIKVSPRPGAKEPFSTPGRAVCPACKAPNPLDATRCGRCSEDIPPPGPSRSVGVSVAPGAGMRGFHQGSIREEEVPEGAHPYDVLPDHVRAELEEKDADRAERIRRAIEKNRREMQRFVGGSAAAVALGGALLSMVAAGGWGVVLLGMLDCALGGAAGYVVSHRGGGTLNGQLGYGGAALVSSALKIGIGFGFGIGGLALFIFSVFFVGAGLILGGLTGHSLEQRYFDEA
jgi:hypothetical protein